MESNTDAQNIQFNFLALNTSHMIYVNKNALDCGPHSNDNDNIKQKVNTPKVFFEGS